ncbi:MAG: hypothetical protein J0I34_15690 [Pseudonocardia sp.]|uniref:hypothetical protein n=1 Tax=unclassified Pseudonocardia TaxID=2619320 RepID=UPI00086CCE69|nr:MULTISPECIES: hypothetical protein [unclassified Pseudonocardia]MBN9110212.1 hypothetical protein [Pseudonocardia sp.]ODU26303.1 MAG: hypothetical protein ABS80_07605 [Pseudonocardia sp. SCN 72-51]ODV06346.1 MAG: hypothetical protein ABT15_12590 [Pseudonocardia sp. SCN 73-27]
MVASLLLLSLAERVMTGPRTSTTWNSSMTPGDVWGELTAWSRRASSASASAMRSRIVLAETRARQLVDASA